MSALSNLTKIIFHFSVLIQHSRSAMQNLSFYLDTFFLSQNLGNVVLKSKFLT